MHPVARNALITLAASAVGALNALVMAIGYPPGSGGLTPAWWVAVTIPEAVALVIAGLLARTARGIALNGLAFVAPQAAAGTALFFLLVHPGGAGGAGLVLGTREYWIKVAAAYAVVTALAGLESWLFDLARRSRSVGGPPA